MITRSAERRPVGGGEILDRGAVHQHVGARLGRIRRQRLGDPVAPEGVEIAARAHWPAATPFPAGAARSRRAGARARRARTGCAGGAGRSPSRPGRATPPRARCRCRPRTARSPVSRPRPSRTRQTARRSDAASFGEMCMSFSSAPASSVAGGFDQLGGGVRETAARCRPWPAPGFHRGVWRGRRQPAWGRSTRVQRVQPFRRRAGPRLAGEQRARAAAREMVGQETLRGRRECRSPSGPR